MGKDDIVRPPLPQQEPINVDMGEPLDAPVDIGKLRQAREFDSMIANLRETAASGRLDGAAMQAFIEQLTAQAKMSMDRMKSELIDDVSKQALEAIADCTTRLATLLPEANARVAGTLAGALRSLAQVRQILENPSESLPGALYGPAPIVGGYLP